MLDSIQTLLINGRSWILAFHIIAVICWFAALFYLPRLFVYHAMSDDDISNQRFKVMERKLYRGIGTPSMIATILLGGALVAATPEYYKSAGWFHTKILMVVLLVAYHLVCRHFLTLFRDDKNTHSHIFYRWFNEAPVLLLIGIVIMVVVKPF